MKSYPLFLLAAFTAIVFCTGCSESEIGYSKDVNPATVYQQYLLSYNEAEQEVEGLAILRFAGENGTTLVLSAPSTIAFDDNILKVDSNDFTGAFYGFKIPCNNFNRKHQFTFTDLNGTRYINEFDAAIPRVKHLPLTTIKSKAINVFFDGLVDGEYNAEVSSSDTDSSFTISSTLGDKISHLEIPAIELMRQKGKQLTLNFSLARKTALKNTAKEGGSLLLEYNLKPVAVKLDETIPVSMVNKKP